MLEREGMGEQEAQLERQKLTSAGGSVRAIGTLQLHLENVRRLAALRDRDASMLDDLADLVRALRTQLVLVRLLSPERRGPGCDSRPSRVWGRYFWYRVGHVVAGGGPWRCPQGSRPHERALYAAA